MQLDATTFILELVNFAVLVWLLHRFLYRPVSAVIDRRRAGIDRSMADAREAMAKAERLRADYDARFAGWERERAQARAALAAELAAARSKGLAEAARAAQAERERLAALAQKRETDLRREAEERALGLAAAFAARLLSRIAGAETQSKLVEAFVEDLAGWPAERMESVARAARAAGGKLAVSSARALEPGERGRVLDALSQRLGLACTADFSVAPELLAGIAVTVGPWTLQADLRDELAFFAQGATHGG